MINIFSKILIANDTTDIQNCSSNGDNCFDISFVFFDPYLRLQILIEAYLLYGNYVLVVMSTPFTIFLPLFRPRIHLDVHSSKVVKICDKISSNYICEKISLYIPHCNLHFPGIWDCFRCQRRKKYTVMVLCTLERRYLSTQLLFY